MSNILKSSFVFVLNAAFYFMLQMVSAFVRFALFGSGNTSAKLGVWVDIFFVFIQILILFTLHRRGVLIKGRLILILNLLSVIAIFLYINIYYIMNPYGSAF